MEITGNDIKSVGLRRFIISLS